MEDDNSGLKILISQRCHRPRVSRMISWEIPKEKLPERSAKQRKKIKKKQPSHVSSDHDSVSSDTELSGSQSNSNESGESEYFSAEESFGSSSESRNSAGSSSALADLDLKDDLQDNHENQSADRSERKRAPSKKQKRRKKELRKLCFADYEIPFRNVENIDLAAADLYEFCPTKVHVNRTVPSLLEIAVHALWSKESYNKLPNIMKSAVSDCRQGQSFASVELSFLYRHLAFAETHMDPFLHGGPLSEPQKYSMELAFRNIWKSSYFVADQMLAFTDYRLTAWLPMTYFTKSSSISNVDMQPLLLISVLSVVMDLMLPRNITNAYYNKSSKHSPSEADANNKATQSLLNCIKDSLTKRYPEIVKLAFHWAVPYAHWTRGNIQLAADAFLENSETINDTHRAYWLSETARMYAQHGESDVACLLYSQAADAAVSRVSVDDVVKQIKAQKWALMADVYDQGPMTHLKAKEAASMWRCVFKYANTDLQGLASRAVESLLCFHSGSRKDVSSKELLKEAKSLLSLQDKQQLQQLHMYLSLIHALLGNESQSETEYRNLSHITSEVQQGMDVLPWTNILEQTVRSGTPDLLTVAWRTQLGHMRIVSSLDVYDGDLSVYPDLHLYMTSDGFLSADLQMVLPSIRNLKLDPYTGFRIYDRLSRVTFPWHSLFIRVKYKYNFVTPTMVELYKDKAGKRVHVLCGHSALIECTPTAQFVTLYWTGPEHQKAKLNLFSHIKKASYQMEIQKYMADKERTFMTNYLKICFTDADHMLTARLKALQTCFEKGWRFWSSDVQNVLKEMVDLEKLKASLSDKTLSDKKKRCFMNRLRIGKRKFTLERKTFTADIQTYYAYDNTLFLRCKNNSESDIIVFIDCSSRENFLNPKIITDHNVVFLKDNFMNSTSIFRFTEHFQTPEIMWQFVQVNGNNVYHIYGQKGNLLKTFSKTDEIFTPLTNTKTPIVLGRKLYGVSCDKFSVICNDLTECVYSEKMPEIVQLSILADKLMVVTGHGLFILHPHSLERCHIGVRCTGCSLGLSDKGDSIDVTEIEVIGYKVISKEPNHQTRVALSSNKHLIIMDIGQTVQLLMCQEVDGVPREVCFLGETSFLVSCTMQKNITEYYREHIFQLSYSGQILAVLPFLGPGPRCFLPVCLSASDDAAAVDAHLGQRGLRVFMRDGHEGIMAIIPK